jgi:hypothetical protein
MPRFSDPMDPSDVESFDVRFRDQIVGDTIATIDTVALDGRSLTEGVELGSGAKAPSILADPETSEAATAVRFFLSVAAAKQANAIYSPRGLTAKVTVRMTTAQGRTLERSVDVIIRQVG